MSSQRQTHHSRTDYSNVLGALIDAQRVQADLVEVLGDSTALFVDTGRVEFLARRALQLISACVDLERSQA